VKALWTAVMRSSAGASPDCGAKAEVKGGGNNAFSISETELKDCKK
jgi:hypothetical protein